MYQLPAPFLLLALALTAGTAHADPVAPGTAYEVFSKNTAFHITGDDKLVVFGVADPAVTGVVCTFTAPVKGGIKSALGFAAQTSDVSLACRQVGPITINDKFGQGDDAFSKSRSFFTKQLHISRGCDTNYNVLVYMAYTDKLIDGSPKNSTSSVPIMPWGDAKAVQRCGDFVK